MNRIILWIAAALIACFQIAYAYEDRSTLAAENGALRVAAGMGQNSAEASLVRTIARGEKVSDIVREGAQLTYTSGNEVALVKLASGERALVMGGPGGISFENMSVTRIFGHSRPFELPMTGPSSFDVNALRTLNQQSSWLYEHGDLIKFGFGSQ